MKKKIYKCSFCGTKDIDKDAHIIVKGEGKAAICTNCVLTALLTIIRRIPNS